MAQHPPSPSSPCFERFFTSGRHSRVDSLSFSRFRCSFSSLPDADNGKEKSNVGFLGLGIMGSAMASNLIRAGYGVTVWNRNAGKCEPLIKQGASCCSSPAEVAAQCNITFAMLADPIAALDVASRRDGVVHGLGPGKGYIDVSTIDGETSKTISSMVKATGAHFLEAPVSGSKKPAEDGTLIFLTAGDKVLYDLAAPMFDVMGKSRFYLGEVGNGAAMKLIVNMIMGSMMASFAEGLSLGSKVGLDASTIIQVISQGAINAPMFALKGPNMIKNNYAAAFPLKHQQKDLRLALKMGESVSQPLPVTAVVNELYKQAKSKGLGDQDFSAVLEAVKMQ